MNKLSHTDNDGRARMVDVVDKEVTHRTATAEVIVLLNAETLELVRENRAAKGDVLTVAKLAGIQAAKRTSELIPLCHPVGLDHVDVEFKLNDSGNTITITATATCLARTGVEMEALTACSVAALTVYDMLKAVQKDIVISGLRLLKKTGGRSGDFIREDP
ncbi:MAG: cyclic pyranopterin monophosphate synthase MoaC [candidate division Zixibacteria bacterium]|nr:cyclic pyranopterin monophosphate synthase MoaC [candidate division Zixibacteria bacterium]MDH3936786.1 cyclic pyranopterin monophosphate synthase MoaC [candidate division Zixibacteria bacterium]MDH4032433.1 cyclic pyranopterin monophosphate synthase MoaC [candidate division Zixibacteria bacterium]